MAVRAAFADVIDWEMTTSQCSNDSAFLVELLIDFYHEGLENIVCFVKAANAFRAGKPNPNMIPAQGGAISTTPEPFIKTLQARSHAVKGTAANLGLTALYKIAAEIELPLKQFMREVEAKSPDDSSVVAARKDLLEKYCVIDRTKIQTFVTEFRKFVDFFQNHIVSCLDEADPVRQTARATPKFGDVSVANFDKIMEAAARLE